MKKKIKLLPISIAASMLISTTAMALPRNTIVLGDKAFSLDTLFVYEQALKDDIFGKIQSALNDSGDNLYVDLEGVTDGYEQLFTREQMSEEQKSQLEDITYHDVKDGSLKEYEYTKFNKIAVRQVSALDRSTIEVTFSNDIVQTFSGYELVDGENNVEFEYEGNLYSVSVSYNESEEVVVESVHYVNISTIQVTFSDGETRTFEDLDLVEGTQQVEVNYNGNNYNVQVHVPPYYSPYTEVESVDFVNYRNIKVTFNNIVDQVSATDARNYYFEIVDGDATLYGDLPTLLESNQLSEIETEYTNTELSISGAQAWWNDQIVASTVNGKTVVDIYLPEDARFTNLIDDENVIDDARTLAVTLRTSKTGPQYLKELIKDKSVNVTVRNVKDQDGQLTINTSVNPIKILDEVKPTLNQVIKIASNLEDEVLLSGELGVNLGEFSLLRTLNSTGQNADKLAFKYSEPVFDAHNLDMSDLELFRNIRVYVNGDIITETGNFDFNDILKFNMDVNSTYEDSKVATLDVEKAVLKAVDEYNETFAVNKNYEIRINGVTDLAGNIEVSSEHKFNVKFYDEDVIQPVIIVPNVEDIVQVADNVFRVEFNRAGATGLLKIKNPDGESSGELLVPIDPSRKSRNNCFYSYVAVPARDAEPNGPVPQGIIQSNMLAYDKQDVIYRDVSVEDVRVERQSGNHIYGNSFYQNSMELVNDIKAPVIVDAEDKEYYGRGTVLKIPVNDVNPWEQDENITPWVAPIAFEYDSSQLRFGNEIVEEQSDADTYLPVEVSYEDKNGSTHTALVSNYDIRPFIGDDTDLNPGYSGSIEFNFDKNILNLDLSNYPQLLDSRGKLIAGTTYKVKFPSGYFTDSPKDTWLTFQESDFEFRGNHYDILYVDEGRDNTNYSCRFRGIVDAGLGYTSAEKEVCAYIGEQPAPTAAPNYVPQTSKQLINYDEPTNSLKVEFTGNIDIQTLKDKNNYVIDGKTLAEWDAELGTHTEIKHVINNQNSTNVRQYAVFTIPENCVQETADYDFIVRGVRHPDGATMTTVQTVIRLMDNYRPVVIEAKVTGDKQIKLVFNEKIQYFVDTAVLADSDSTARNFKVVIGGQTWTVVTAVLPLGSSNEREVTLNLGNTIPDDGDITVEIVKDQNQNILIIDKSEGKNPMAEEVYTVNR